METEIVIVGAGAHARVVYDILRAARRESRVVAFVDVEEKSEPGPAEMLGVPVLAGLDALAAFAASRDVAAILGHGSNSRRRDLLPRLDALAIPLATAIHPSAVISPDVEIGGATTVSAGAVIVTGARLGRAVIINTAATVDHDCVVEDCSQIAPGAHLAGRVKVGAEAFVGIGAVVIQGVSVGSRAVVGAGAAVVRDAPAGCLVIGVPARVRKHL